MPKRTFTQAELTDLLAHHAVHTEITDEDDHCTYKATVVKIGSRHYEIAWADQAVGGPTFFGPGARITAIEVEQRPVTVMQWVPVDEAIADAAGPVRESRATWERIAAAIQARGDELRESGGELSSREVRDAYHDAARMVREAATPPTTHRRDRPGNHTTERPK